jgi:SAM-dependent methyltransferase
VLDPTIAEYYDLAAEEGRLFVDGRPRLEYVRTLELLDRLLPDPPARVLDVGGGTGVYAVPLCERGYAVDLIDPVPLHVDRARALADEQGLEHLTARLGDARDLGGETGVYDAVLVLGPLYHLTDRRQRMRAWHEAVRVLRTGGVLVAAGISRFASLLDGLRRGILGDDVFRAIVEEDLHSGQHRNPERTSRPEYFTTAYFHTPDELEREALDAGLAGVELYAVEGPAWIVENPDQREHQLYSARAVETERSLMSASAHILVTGRRPRRPTD